MKYQELRVSLHISALEFQRLYRGEASTVQAQDSQGRHIQFPASALRKFVTREGIHGAFVLRIDKGNRLIDICRQRS